MLVIAQGDAPPPRGAPCRAVLVDPATGACGALVADGRGAAHAMLPAGAPPWMRAGLGPCVFVQPRREVRFRRGGDAGYMSEQVPACAGGEAAHFALSYDFRPGWTPRALEVRLPWAQGNACFAQATLQCLVRCGLRALWEEAAPVAPRVTEAPPAFEALARAHLREALRQHAEDGRDAALAAAKHLVGHVLRTASDRAPDLDDGRQHDCCEFLLRLLGALGWEPEARLSEQGALAWRLARPPAEFQERAGGQPPAGARAAVTHSGGPGGGHYTARGASPGGWHLLEGNGERGTPCAWPSRDRLKLVFM
jgi:hypothetical protein